MNHDPGEGLRSYEQDGSHTVKETETAIDRQTSLVGSP